MKKKQGKTVMRWWVLSVKEECSDPDCQNPKHFVAAIIQDAKTIVEACGAAEQKMKPLLVQRYKELIAAGVELPPDGSLSIVIDGQEITPALIPDSFLRRALSAEEIGMALDVVRTLKNTFNGMPHQSAEA